MSTIDSFVSVTKKRKENVFVLTNMLFKKSKRLESVYGYQILPYSNSFLFW